MVLIQIMEIKTNLIKMALNLLIILDKIESFIKIIKIILNIDFK